MDFCAKPDLDKFEHLAAPGTGITYYTGLSVGRGIEDQRGDKKRLALAINIINRVRLLYNFGRLELSQRRIGPKQFEHMATYRKRPASIAPEAKLWMLDDKGNQEIPVYRYGR